MKNTTLILAGFGLIGYLGYRAKTNAEALALAIAAKNATPPPPANSGPVVNGLSLYQLEGLGGFGSKFKGAVNKVVESAPVQIIKKIDPAAAITAKAVQAIQDKKTPLDALNKLPGMTSLTSKLPFVKKVGSPASAQPEPGQAQTFADINGTPITEAQYNDILKSMSTVTPIPTSGGWAIPDGYIMTQAQYEASVYFPRPVSRPAPVPYSPPGSSGQSSPYASTYQWPREHNKGPGNDNLNITNTYSDDYSEGPGTPRTASSAGAPGLPPGLTTSMAQPAVTEEAPMYAEAAPKSKTPMYLVGTALAAGAAYLAFS